MFRTLGFALVLAFAGSPTANAEPVRIGLDVWLGYGPLWVAQKQGYFAKHGVDVELTIIHLDQGIRVAMRNGEIDVAASPTNGLILEFNRGIRQKAFLVLDTSLQADAILAGPDIGGVAELKGKTVAYEVGTTSDLLLGYALRANGLSLADVEFLPMPASEAGPALADSKVAAAVTYEPYISSALAMSDDIRVIFTAAEKPGLISDVLAATPSWISANANDVRGLIRAWDDAVRFIRDHPEEGLKTVAEAIGRSPDEIRSAFDGLRLYAVADNASLLDGDFQTTVVDIGEIMREIHPNEITTVPSADSLLSLDDLRAVAAEGR